MAVVPHIGRRASGSQQPDLLVADVLALIVEVDRDSQVGRLVEHVQQTVASDALRVGEVEVGYVADDHGVLPGRTRSALRALCPGGALCTRRPRRTGRPRLGLTHIAHRWLSAGCRQQPTEHGGRAAQVPSAYHAFHPDPPCDHTPSGEGGSNSPFTYPAQPMVSARPLYCFSPPYVQTSPLGPPPQRGDHRLIGVGFLSASGFSGWKDEQDGFPRKREAPWPGRQATAGPEPGTFRGLDGGRGHE